MPYHFVDFVVLMENQKTTFYLVFFSFYNTPESLWPVESLAKLGLHAKCFISSVFGFVVVCRVFFYVVSHTRLGICPFQNTIKDISYLPSELVI